MTTKQTEDFTGATQSWEARTTSAPAWLPRSALAAQSMHTVERITDAEQRRKAFAAHMAAFPPLIGRP